MIIIHSTCLHFLRCLMCCGFGCRGCCSFVLHAGTGKWALPGVCLVWWWLLLCLVPWLVQGYYHRPGLPQVSTLIMQSRNDWGNKCKSLACVYVCILYIQVLLISYRYCFFIVYFSKSKLLVIVESHLRYRPDVTLNGWLFDTALMMKHCIHVFIVFLFSELPLVLVVYFLCCFVLITLIYSCSPVTTHACCTCLRPLEY